MDGRDDEGDVHPVEKADIRPLIRGNVFANGAGRIKNTCKPKRHVMGTSQIGSEKGVLATGRCRLVGDEAEMLDEVLQNLESSRADSDELDAKAVVFRPANGRQFDLNGTRLGRQQHGELQVIPFGDGHVTCDRSATQGEIVDAAFPTHQIAGERHASTNKKSFKFPLIHI